MRSWWRCIDAVYMTPTVDAFCREAGELFRPSIGRDADRQRQQWYNRPTQTGAVVCQFGEGFHLNHIEPNGCIWPRSIRITG